MVRELANKARDNAYGSRLFHGGGGGLQNTFFRTIEGGGVAFSAMCMSPGPGYDEVYIPSCTQQSRNLLLWNKRERSSNNDKGMQDKNQSSCLHKEGVTHLHNRRD